ncbi:hypothetical protein WCLP8_50033 [uncultured Gammaproteobacteria bacterium]
MGGRPGLNDDATRVPSVDQVRRARMILDELRRFSLRRKDRLL